MDFETFIVNVEAVVWHESRYLMIVRGETEEIAPGTLTPPGGKVEAADGEQDVLEATLRREVREEAGIEVANGFAYVESHAFRASGETIVDIVFLCRYQGGTPRAGDATEVSDILWLTYDELMTDERTMPWTKATMVIAEALRKERGW